MERQKKHFVLGGMDAEMKTILNIIENREDCKVLNDGLNWSNSTYDNLTDSTKGAINLALANGEKVYGLELRGHMEGVINVDHHTYPDDDRYNTKATIEQVAEILGIELTPFQVAVALNDKGFIYAMDEAGVESEIIQQVRRLDRECQGVTVEMEDEAEKCLKNQLTIGDLTVVMSSHNRSSCYADRLYKKCYRLLVISKDEINFYGSFTECASLFEKFGGWSGGNSPNGYWGISFTDKPENLISEWKLKFEILNYFNL